MAWLNEFVKVLGSVKDMLTKSHFKFTDNSDAAADTGVKIPFEFNYIHILHHLKPEFHGEFGESNLFAEKISLRVTILQKYIQSVKSSMTKIVNALKDSTKNTPPKKGTKVETVATYKSQARHLFNRIQMEFASFANLLENGRPMMLFDDQKEVRKTIHFLRGESEAIRQFRDNINDTEDHQWMLDVIGILQNDVNFIKTVNIEISMVNRHDIRELDTLIASKHSSIAISTFLSSDLMKKFQSHLHEFFEFIKEFDLQAKLDGISIFEQFQYEYVEKLLKKYAEKIRHEYLRPGDKEELKQLIDDIKIVPKPMKIFWTQRECKRVMRNIKICYETLKMIKDAVNEDSEDLIENAERAIFQADFQLARIINDDFNEDYDKNLATHRESYQIVFNASKNNKHLQTALKEFLIQRFGRLEPEPVPIPVVEEPEPAATPKKGRKRQSVKKAARKR